MRINSCILNNILFFSRKEITLTLISDVHLCRRYEVTSVRGKLACVYARVICSAILVSYDADDSRSFTGGKQSGRILMDYTCKHRLLQDHGSPISPIVVYTRCVNIMFYRWNPTRESAKGRGIGQTSASSCSFDGTRSEKSACSNVSHRHAVVDYLRESRNSGKLQLRARCIYLDSFPPSPLLSHSRSFSCIFIPCKNRGYSF